MNPLKTNSLCKWLGFGPITVYSLVGLLLSNILVTQARGAHPFRIPAPEFLPGAVNVTVRPGDAALLPCSVRYLGTKKVVWRNVKEDRFLTIGETTWVEDPNISLDYSDKPDQVTNWDLVIRHVKPEDAGIYECQITSQASHIRRVMLSVVGPPITEPDSSQQHNRHRHHHQVGLEPNQPVSVCGSADMSECLIRITGKKFVNRGERLELVCNATGGPRIPDEIDWFKTGNKIDSDKQQYRHAVITKFQSIADRSFISKLIIKHANLDDTGDYICRSSRNDIANLKVTVLHTDKSDNTRRDSSKQWDHRNANENSSTSNSPQLLFLLVMTLACHLFARGRLRLNS